MSEITPLHPIQHANPTSLHYRHSGSFQGMVIEIGNMQDITNDIGFSVRSHLHTQIIAQSCQKGRKAIFQDQANQLFESARKLVTSQMLGDFSNMYGVLFRNFLTELKFFQKKRSYTLSNVRELTEQTFDDPSIQHAAVLAAAEMENSMTGGNSMEQMLRKLAQILVEDNGSAIRAGYNINSTVALFARKNFEDFRTLREAYRTVLLSDMNEEEIYNFVVHVLPIRLSRLLLPKVLNAKEKKVKSAKREGKKVNSLSRSSADHTIEY